MADTKKIQKTSKTKFRPRLHVNGRVVSFRRSRHVQHPNSSLLRLEGVRTQEETKFYVGKRVAYLYKGKNPLKDKQHKMLHGHRVIWGKIVRPHGNSGVVRARFEKNLPGDSIARPVKVFLYPSRI
eukprot:gb/GECH01011154.1/.p1 GENE.gb/GECH01011154.1/~~gb/GECH01011154.1/.p1  ORF type:complete len:126 (+),score=7.24 gb/GECH01011154.1/:1-378(+)